MILSTYLLYYSIFLYSPCLSGLLNLHSHAWLCHFLVSLSEICAGCAAWAAVRAGVPVPEGGGRTHLRVRGCYHGRGCSQDCPADHQAGGQHEPGGRWLVHQQASGTTDGSSVVEVLFFARVATQTQERVPPSRVWICGKKILASVFPQSKDDKTIGFFHIELMFTPTLPLAIELRTRAIEEVLHSMCRT